MAAETEVRWLDPAGRDLPWLREKFISRLSPLPRRRANGLRAITVDGRGRVVRSFSAHPRDLKAYAELQATGWGTCPIEGVRPDSIVPGQPAEPAHPGLREEQKRRRQGVGR